MRRAHNYPDEEEEGDDGKEEWLSLEEVVAVWSLTIVHVSLCPCVPSAPDPSIRVDERASHRFRHLRRYTRRLQIDHTPVSSRRTRVYHLDDEIGCGTDRNGVIACETAMDNRHRAAPSRRTIAAWTLIVVAAIVLVAALALFTPGTAPVTRPDQIGMLIAALVFVSFGAVFRFRPAWRRWYDRRHGNDR
jgi:hypothetical protein